MLTTEEKSEYVKTLAKRIQELRIKAGYTSYEKFAFEKDIPRAQYGRYEQGTDIRFTSLILVARAHGMTLEEFFAEGFEGVNISIR